MSKVIGIDLGTTNSCVAVMEGNKAVVISNAEGIRTTPSVVAFTKNGERLIGETAKRQAITNSEKTVSSIKRKMGTNYKVNIDNKLLSPQEISAMILQKLKKDAENYLGEPVSEAVITVPAYFNDLQRQATKDAGRIAGLNVKRIINEPTSAALAYGLLNESSQKIIVYDLGGGTFDVSIIEINDGVIEVLATSGNNHLGGDDIDEKITSFLIDKFIETNGIDLSKDNIALQRIKEAAEKAKKDLSTQMSVNINLPFICMNGNEPKHIDVTLTRSNFEYIIKDIVDATKGPVTNALNDAGLTFKDISKILLVGGSTRIPIIQETIKKMSGIEPAKVLNPDECVALGAAIQGDILQNNATALLLLDVTPLTLSIKLANGESKPLIKRNSTIPTSFTDIFTTNEDYQENVFVELYQGERLMAKDNYFVGSAEISGILPAKKALPIIEITFSLDENGIIKISAIDKATNKKTNAVIKSQTLSNFDIERAIRDATEFESIDKEYKEKINLINEAEALIIKTKDNIKKYDFDDELKKNFNFKIDELQILIDDSQNVDSLKLKEAIKEFKESTNKYYTSFYESINETNNNPYSTSSDGGFDFYNKF